MNKKLMIFAILLLCEQPTYNQFGRTNFDDYYDSDQESFTQPARTRRTNFDRNNSASSSDSDSTGSFYTPQAAVNPTTRDASSQTSPRTTRRNQSPTDNNAPRKSPVQNNRPLDTQDVYDLFVGLINDGTSIDYFYDLYNDIVDKQILNLEDFIVVLHHLVQDYQYNNSINPDVAPFLNKALHTLLSQRQQSRPNVRSIDPADALINQCYISPEMQYAVISYVADNEFTVNAVTGKVANIPSISRILDGSTNRSSNRYGQIDDEARINALHAALEAIKLAKFVAGLNVAYDNPHYPIFAPNINSDYFMPPIDKDLQASLDSREKDIRSALGDNLSWRSWVWSWVMIIPNSLSDMFTIKNKTHHGLATPLQIRPNMKDIGNASNLISIPDTTMHKLIKHYNYKQIVDHKHAAELLWKQCLLALQDFTDNDLPIYCFTTSATISATHYTYDNLTINSHHARTLDHVCSSIENAVSEEKCSKQAAHALLLQLRKAVQTAMFIANKDSMFNIGYKLPTKIIGWLDKIISYLYELDAKLDKLCKKFGTTDDFAREYSWNKITAILTTGIVVAGAGYVYLSKSKTPTVPPMPTQQPHASPTPAPTAS